MSFVALVVEDDEDLVFLYRTALETKGFEVHGVTSTSQTLRLLGEQGLVPDIIFLDIEMPDQPGSQVLDYLRGKPQFARTRVVVITANETYRERLAPQVDRFELKPITISHLTKLAEQLTHP